MSDRTNLRRFLMLGTLAAAILAASVAWAMRFSHIIHEQEGFSDCARCHVPGAISIIPARSICLECHEETSIAETVLGPTRSHTPLWIKGHGTESQSAEAQCRKCHSLPFCVDCHKGGELDTDLSRRTARFDSAPSTHTARFRIVHPLKALGEQIEQCYTCHQRQECVDCHEDYRNRFPSRELVSHQRSWQMIIARPDLPDHSAFTLNQCQDCHPGGALSGAEWSSGHAREARRTLSGCQSCHPDGQACLSCHSAKTGLMVSPHPRNWGKIKGKFRRESPEVCDRCH